jgi:hypothetical protein
MNERVLQSNNVMGNRSAVLADEAPKHDLRECEIAKPPCWDPMAPTIFHEDWWLEIATGGRFAIAEVKDAGRTVGRLPYCVTSRFGMKMIRMPALTYFLGPAVDEGVGNPTTRSLRRLEITREMLGQLPRTAWQYVKCHRRIPDVIAFQELGFRAYVQFTHEIAPNPVAVLWQQMRSKTRNAIRRATELFSVTEMTDAAEFMRLFATNLEAKGLKIDIDVPLCQKIIASALGRNRGAILAARDENNQLVAANVCVWDELSYYYLLSTRCDGAGNGAISLLLWEAIKESSRKGLLFDFAGLGNAGSVRLYSGFGGSVSGRYTAVRSTRLARLLNEVKFLFAPENPFY